MCVLAILGELCWLQFFKTVYLETSNVRFGSFFQNPVTYYTTDIMVFEIYTKRYTYLGKGAIVRGFTAISTVFIPLLVLVSNRHIPKLRHCHSNNLLPFSLGPGVGYSL